MDPVCQTVFQAPTPTTLRHASLATRAAQRAWVLGMGIALNVLQATSLIIRHASVATRAAQPAGVLGLRIVLNVLKATLCMMGSVLYIECR